MNRTRTAQPMSFRKTPLFELHSEHKGSLVPWRGQLLPSHYTGILEEHVAANEDLVMFDLGFRGLARLEGRDAGALINRLATLETLNLPVGRLCEVPFVYPDGTLVDLVRAAHEEENVWLLSFSNPHPKKTFDWIRQEATGSECWVNDVSHQYAWVALMGPRAHDYLVCGSPAIEKLEPGCMMEALVAGVAVQVFRADKNFYALACRPELLEKVVHAWWVGDDRPRLCGWASYENWRLEKGVLRYERELTEGANPFELGLDSKIDLSREHFVGRSALIAYQKEGLRQMLVYFTLQAMRLPRAGAPVYSGDRRVGFVCSGGFSPTLRQPIGSAWVQTHEVDFDTLTVELRSQRYEMTIKKPPFA